jgi:DNA-binding transcriptional regulator YiaG
MTSRKSGRRTFVRGNERLDKLLARRVIAAGVAEVEVEAREMDRVYAENLAMIRRASDLTQVEVAEKLGVGQAVVSRLERRSDMLLSTLADYLHATGAEHPRIVVVLNGMEVELDLDQFRESRSA